MGYRGLHSSCSVILGIRSLKITMDVAPSMTSNTIRKRIGYVVERMRSERTGKVVFSDDFPYRELILREGFDETDDRLLKEIVAGKIVKAFSGKDKVAAFFGRRLTGEAERVFSEMCQNFKYVMAAVETDGGLYHSMGKRFGISVIGQPTEKQLEKADVAVFFCPPATKTVLPEKCVVIPVTGGALKGVICRKIVSEQTIALVNGKKHDIPNGFPHEPFYSAALDAGTLRREDLQIYNLKIRDLYE